MISNATFGSAFFVLFTLSAVFSSPTKLADEEVKKLSVANDNMALKLYQHLSANSAENICFSPFSLSSVFGMLFYAAKGNTAEELRTVLGYEKAGLQNEQVHSSFNQFLTDYLPVNNSSSSEYSLDVANSILLDKKLDLIPTFKSSGESYYQSSVRLVDFMKDGHNIVKEINQWVEKKTHGKINQILSEVSPSTVMILLNAIYFKGTWKIKFEPDRTVPEMFYNSGLESAAKEVPMMHSVAKYLYGSADDFQFLELPYMGESVSMLIFLPKQRDGLPAFEKSLTLEKISEVRQKAYPTKVSLSFPKFKIEYFKELSSEFQALGANKIFSADAANFSGMTTSKGVYISEILHKSVIEVNEEGSEAAAASAFAHLNSAVKFNVDHPFLFTIVDKRSDMALFVGRVNVL